MSLSAVAATILGLSGTDRNGAWHVDARRHGPFAPLLYAAPTPQGWHLVSSPLTQTEWWTSFLLTHRCPRFAGAMGTQDAFAKDCADLRCETACGAEDGFVELRANRFRLDVDRAVIARHFPYLDQFLRRAETLVEQANAAGGLDWGLARHQHLAYLQAAVSPAALEPHLEALGRLFPLISGVSGTLDVEWLPPIDIEALDLEQEDDLMRLARHYAEVESLRHAAGYYFADLVASRGGQQEGIEFKLPDGLRYLLTTHVECFQGDHGYMGRVEFRRGLGEIRQFVATTLGGGRW